MKKHSKLALFLTIVSLFLFSLSCGRNSGPGVLPADKTDNELKDPLGRDLVEIYGPSGLLRVDDKVALACAPGEKITSTLNIKNISSKVVFCSSQVKTIDFLDWGTDNEIDPGKTGQEQLVFYCPKYDETTTVSGKITIGFDTGTAESRISVDINYDITINANAEIPSPIIAVYDDDGTRLNSGDTIPKGDAITRYEAPANNIAIKIENLSHLDVSYTSNSTSVWDNIYLEGDGSGTISGFDSVEHIIIMECPDLENYDGVITIHYPDYSGGVLNIKDFVIIVNIHCIE